MRKTRVLTCKQPFAINRVSRIRSTEMYLCLCIRIASRVRNAHCWSRNILWSVETSSLDSVWFKDVIIRDRRWSLRTNECETRKISLSYVALRYTSGQRKTRLKVLLDEISKMLPERSHNNIVCVSFPGYKYSIPLSFFLSQKMWFI